MIDSTSRGPSGPSLKPVIFAVLASFLLGASVVGYLAWRGYFAGDELAEIDFDSEPSALASADPSPSPTPSATETEQAAAAVERVEQTQGGLDQRIAAAEQRIARLDLQAQAAAGNASRAEGLLIAFATRRAIERGAELGYLGDQLRLRFADAQPNSVATVIEFARDPVTLDVLLARLDGLGPQLATSTDQPTFARLRNELASLFVIRRETTPSPQPSRRLERARMFLESGRVDKAIGEVEQMPGAEQAEQWLADARRYERAQRALDLIETTAVREPRRLRDSQGRPIEQPGPAESAIQG
ncbi:Mitochondrial inner membrane protein [Tsuneonella dongtanensis]|uniref:Mitochondrial inner membrane protein n=1 Tax=Tsuneonella dongtanensis TaxID=692370 RepID=A0A1B2AFS0_9SPHN|nr:mitofilin family membrane protein [Tsuneonella dongtanensis]ANY20976.1 Mitochondrial inner membrane protein [Tsuneonella dongtanensis]